jgi:Mg2+ and Co2+ transporter CorA
MKSLTAIGAIILPMQLVASLWGMNSVVPWGHYDRYTSWHDYMPFMSICLAMLIVTLVMITYFRRKGIM